MNLIELRKLISSGETQKVEFKRTTSQKKPAAQTLCAMLNTDGGHVIFGVTDNKEIKGQEVVSKTIEDVVAELRKISPFVSPEIFVIPVEKNRSVIVLKVLPKNELYSYDGRKIGRAHV